MPGLRVWDNPGNGFTVFELLLDADPAKRSPEAKAKLFAGMAPEKIAREFMLDFKAKPGVSPFPNFAADTHFRDWHYNPSLPLFRSWDFGVRWPGCVYLQTDDLNRLRVLDEVFGESFRGLSTYEFAREVLKHHARRGYGPIRSEYCDVAGNALTSKGKRPESDVQQLMKLGISKPQMKHIGRKEQYDAIKDRISDLDYPDGIPGLSVGESARHIRDALSGSLKMPPKADALPKDGYYEHLMEPLGYFCVLYYGLKFKRRYGRVQQAEALGEARVARERQRGPNLAYIDAQKQIAAEQRRAIAGASRDKALMKAFGRR